MDWGELEGPAGSAGMESVTSQGKLGPVFLSHRCCWVALQPWVSLWPSVDLASALGLWAGSLEMVSRAGSAANS